MTKVQIHFRLQRPLDSSMLSRIEGVNVLYGIQRVRVAPSMDRLTVDYDATRLRPAEVESALAAAGIPIAPEAA
jgi:allophanate hydrolase subunit 1